MYTHYIIVKPCVWGIIADNQPDPEEELGRGRLSSNNSKVAAVVTLFCTIVTIANTLKDDRILCFRGESSLMTGYSINLCNTNSSGALDHTTLPLLAQNQK